LFAPVTGGTVAATLGGLAVAAGSAASTVNAHSSVVVATTNRINRRMTFSIIDVSLLKDKF
jgi:3-hydroxyisobutyrate dehydrogenase-like beta-hydroxyacid dehydrogenase